jgi:hypothetical protein
MRGILIGVLGIIGGLTIGYATQVRIDGVVILGVLIFVGGVWTYRKEARR